MNYAYRVEHMFRAMGGEVWVLRGLRHTKLSLNDKGAPVVLITDGLTPDQRADEIGSAVMRLLLERLTPQQLLLLLHLVATRHTRPVTATFGER